MQWKLFIWLLSSMVLFTTSKQERKPTAVVEPAPNFTVQKMDGSNLSLSDLRGQVVYVSFWASWCGPCISGFNKYQAMRQQMEALGVVMLNVSIDETEAAWQSGLQRIPEGGIQAFAKQDKTELIHNYQLSSIPAYYIIDKKGNFAYLSSDPERDILAEFKAMVEQQD